jgi:hypothetical protein
MYKLLSKSNSLYSLFNHVIGKKTGVIFYLYRMRTVVYLFGKLGVSQHNKN